MSKPPASIGRRLRFSQLELINEVVDCGNLSEAATRLHLTRAAVSKSIKELERVLGKTLFERSRLGMTPTGDGLMVAKHARFLVNELKHFTDEVGSGATSGGQLRLGMPAFVAEYIAPSILSRIQERSAGERVTVHIHEGRLHSLIEKLLGGEVDAVLTLFSPSAVSALDLSMLDINPFRSVPIGILAAPSLGVPKKRLRWEDLLAFPWILPPATTHQRRSLDEMFTVKGLRAPLPSIESSSLTANVRIAAAGLGLAVAPVEIAADEIAAGRLQVVDVRPALPDASVALMYRKVTMMYLDALRTLVEHIA